MVRVPIAVLLLACAPAAVLAQGNNQQTDLPVIVAQGEAVLRRMPDRAFLAIATEVRDGKAANARRKSAEGMTEIRAAIVAAGVPEAAIRTSGYSLQPELQYSGGRPSVRNYVVRNQVEVRLDDLDKLADVIDAANMPKNVAVTIGSPRYELKDREAAEIEAMRLAVQSAMARARALAAGAGQTLGPVQRIQQGSVGFVAPPQPYRATTGIALLSRGGGAADAAPVEAPPVPETPITPGDLEIRATVSVTVAIR